MTRPRDTVARRMKMLRSAAFVQHVQEALYECADRVASEAHHSISAGSIQGTKHVPSKPGEPPNLDTGVLQAHLYVDQKLRLESNELEATVISDAPYAAALEFGTSKMAARPYMRPARDKVRPEAVRILNRRIQRAMKGS